MFQIDNQSRQAIYEQIIEQIEQHILVGILSGGDKMPSVRSLSVTLHINPNTVQRAYTELERDGILVTAPGRGAFVHEEGFFKLKHKKQESNISKLRMLVNELQLYGMSTTELTSLFEEALHDKSN